MKIIVVLLLLIIFCIAFCGQTGPVPHSQQSDGETTVATLLADNGLAPVPGFVATLLSRLGDGAAVGVIQYLGERQAKVFDDLTSPQEIRRILYIIRTAFAVSNIIEADENRSPKATFVLLKYLSCLPTARTEKEDLESTGEFVEKIKQAFSTTKTPEESKRTSFDSSAQQTVAILLADNGQAPIPGFLETLVSQLGDDAAVGVIQYLGDREMTSEADLTTPQEIKRILEIIRMAFAVPNADHPDRTRIPKATLVLLKYLSCLPAARTEKEDLESTSKFVEKIKLAVTTAK